MFHSVSSIVVFFLLEYADLYTTLAVLLCFNVSVSMRYELWCFFHGSNPSKSCENATTLSIVRKMYAYHSAKGLRMNNARNSLRVIMPE
jgi:hypothetical protein